MDQESGRYLMEFNESLAFFIFIHISENLKYRLMYDQTLSKCRAHTEFLTHFMMGTFPMIYDRLINDCMLIDLNPLFCKTVLTMFVYDLQAGYPETARHIFDIFLFDGESVMFTLVTKFITLQHDFMLDIEDDNDF